MTHLRRRSRSVRRRAAIAALAGAAIAAVVIACGGGKPPPEQPTSFGAEATPDAAPVADAAPPDEPPPPDAPPMTTVTLPATAPVVTRVKRGKRPAELRYALPAPGDTPAQIVDQTFETAMEITEVGVSKRVPLPDQAVGSTLAYTAVGAEAGAPPSLALVQRMNRGLAADAAMSSQFEDARGSELAYTIDDRGRAGDVRVLSRATDDAGAQQVLSLLRGNGGPIVLPAEPIGVGGSWRVVERHPVANTATEVTTTYTIKARDGDRLTLTGTIETRTPAYTTDRVAHHAAAGTGTLTATLDLGRPAPEISASLRFDGAITMDGRAQRIVMTYEVRQVTRDR
jgi:hypothetical protein